MRMHCTLSCMQCNLPSLKMWQPVFLLTKMEGRGLTRRWQQLLVCSRQWPCLRLWCLGPVGIMLACLKTAVLNIHGELLCCSGGSIDTGQAAVTSLQGAGSMWLDA